MKIILATSNNGKLIEIQQALSNADFAIQKQTDLNVPDAEETGLTFIENAIIKARNACEHTNLPSLADDSGMVVDELNGEPGIYSARYAGEHGDFAKNIEKVLKLMQDIPQEKRSARFVSVMAFMRHANDPMPIITQGVWEGSILYEKQGDKGFGYDPIFWIPTHQCSAAELTLEEKNSMSHRGQALEKMLQLLREECRIN